MATLLDHGFRPFFLLSGLYAVAAMVVWLALLLGWFMPPLAMNGLDWHAHEMLFGVVTAAAAGFLMTAVPNWTGRLPIDGMPLLLLVLLWGAGRLAVTFGGGLSAWTVAAVDLSFLAAFTFAIARELLAGKWNPRQFPILAVLLALLAANGLTHAARIGHEEELAALGRRLAVDGFLFLIVVVGGRLVPSFTSSWLGRKGAPVRPASEGPVDRFAIAITGVAALADVIWPETGGTSALLIAAGVITLARLARWQGHRTFREPILWVLHLGYLWAGIGFGLLGLAGLVRAVEYTSASHAATAGAMGTMIMAVMTRAALGHTGREIKAAPAIVVAYLLVTLGAGLRVLSPWVAPSGPGSFHYLGAAGGLWLLAFLIFTIVYWPILTQARRQS